RRGRGGQLRFFEEKDGGRRNALGTGNCDARILLPLRGEVGCSPERRNFRVPGAKKRGKRSLTKTNVYRHTCRCSHQQAACLVASYVAGERLALPGSSATCRRSPKNQRLHPWAPEIMLQGWWTPAWCEIGHQHDQPFHPASHCGGSLRRFSFRPKTSE
ncbi:unnamed protein product, partial [Scytosiphon promiscuus]